MSRVLSPALARHCQRDCLQRLGRSNDSNTTTRFLRIDVVARSVHSCRPLLAGNKQQSVNSQPSNAEKEAKESEKSEVDRSQWRASTVPATRAGRLFHYGSLAASLTMGAASEAFRRVSSPNSDQPQRSMFLSEANISRLVSKLSRMRGAALKMGQFLSIQGIRNLSPEIAQILVQLQDRADYMPKQQTERVIGSSLGSDWQKHFQHFDFVPVASASIGQVHKAKLTTGQSVAVKVQFPGVADSIRSDLGNLKMLIMASAVLPRGLYLDNTIKVMQRELLEECDYEREAQSGRLMAKFLENDADFSVPKIIDHLSTKSVLTTDWMEGISLGRIKGKSQEWRDEIGTKMLRLCLRELFEFKIMQTDPNWSNFLWNEGTKVIELIDFGASRHYTQAFVDKFQALLLAAVAQNKDDCVRYSRDIGYFTGEENQSMIDAHVKSLYILAEPFRVKEYSFVDQTITDRVQAEIPKILQNRLTPPPNETYSLNRKLSGCFLLCAQLGSTVKCQDLLRESLTRARQTATA